jgi:hypothetical protein
MIIINAINNDGNFEPETIPDLKFGSHFNGTEFLFFENDDERELFYIDK